MLVIVLRRALKLSICLGLTAAAAPLPARADEPTQAPDNKAAAQQHFTRAKELYNTGNYREALAELESARALDPQAKDLVFNLGIVTERLGRLEEALKWYRVYLEMTDLTPAERQRAETTVKRLEGAKRETPAQPPTAPLRPATRAPAEEPPKGRIDALTIGSAALAVSGLAVGTIFAFKALGDRPKSGFVTGRDGSYAELQDQADTAHTEAIVADVALGVGVAFAVVTAVLYFTRPKVVSDAPTFAATRWAGPVGALSSGSLFAGRF
jgi:tetratricopeptide (TPR) repeat protein